MSLTRSGCPNPKSVPNRGVPLTRNKIAHQSSQFYVCALLCIHSSLVWYVTVPWYWSSQLEDRVGNPDDLGTEQHARERTNHRYKQVEAPSYLLDLKVDGRRRECWEKDPEKPRRSYVVSTELCDSPATLGIPLLFQSFNFFSAFRASGSCSRGGSLFLFFNKY